MKRVEFRSDFRPRGRVHLLCVYDVTSPAYPSETTDLVSSNECDGVGSPAAMADILCSPSSDVGEPTFRLLRLAELMGREKFNGERPLRLPPPAEIVKELVDFSEGERSFEGT